MPKLTVLTENVPVKEFMLHDGISTIGRAKDNVLHIPDASISSHHGEFIVAGEEVTFRDIGSTNGSFIGDEQIVEAVLMPGQVFRIGFIDFQLGGEGIVDAPRKKGTTKIQALRRGVNPTELETGKTPLHVPAAFHQKNTRGQIVFISIGIALCLVVIALLLLTLWYTHQANQ
jgi:pSer/pThr/pTyr-binding forkhead associated (FHA) protein